MNRISMLLLVLLWALSSVSCTEEDQETSISDTDTNTEKDPGPDTGSDSAVDTNCHSSWGFRDPNTGLCWQNPPDVHYMDWQQATDYCNDLATGGFTDWRMPDIDELISLLRGCNDGIAGEAHTLSNCTMIPAGCATTDSCEEYASCGQCEYYDGPAPDGCYWISGLSGSCNNAYWSSSTEAGNGVTPWFALFGNGSVHGYGTINSVFSVRCLRNVH